MAATLRAALPTLLARLPGRPTATWPDGEPFVEALRHGSMSVELFAPRGTDHQIPHAQDELYVILSGQAHFEHNGTITEAAAGDVLFVPAGDPHAFLGMSHDFMTWVIFWGPDGGERMAAP